MPDLRSIHSPLSAAAQSDAQDPGDTKYPITRYYPGRSVSVQFGRPLPNHSFTAQTHVRIVILFEVGDIPHLDVRLTKLRTPSVIVQAAWEPDILEAFTSERIVTLFVETRFVREIASSEVAGMTIGNLAEIGRKNALAAQLTFIFCALVRRVRRPSSFYIESLGTVMVAHVLHYFFDGEAPADRRRGFRLKFRNA